MNYFRILFFLFLLLQSIAPVFAAKTPKPDPAITGMETRYKSLKSWQASFEQTSFVEVLGQNVAKNGTIAVLRPNQLRIEYASDPQKIYIANGKKLWVYQPQTKSAQEFDNPEKLISKEALSFLSGLAEASMLFDAIADLTIPKEFPQIRDTKLKKISLIPKDPESAVLRLILGVDPESFILREAVLFNASGSVTHYAFRNIEFDAEIPANRFALPEGEKIKIQK